MNTTPTPSTSPPASFRKVLYATLAFPPAGIFLGWRNGDWSRSKKVGWTVVGLFVFMAWGGVLGLIQGSPDASFSSLFKAIVLAAAAYAMFAIWTHPHWRVFGKVAYTICTVLALTVVAGITGEGRSGTAALEPTGKKFSKSQMEKFFKKAATLRLGMSMGEVCSIMGPPTKRHVFDPAKLPAVPGLPVIDPRPQDTLTWSSAEDPGEIFVMVFLRGGETYAVKAENRQGVIVSLEDL